MVLLCLSMNANNTSGNTCRVELTQSFDPQAVTLRKSLVARNTQSVPFENMLYLQFNALTGQNVVSNTRTVAMGIVNRTDLAVTESTYDINFSMETLAQAFDIKVWRDAACTQPYEFHASEYNTLREIHIWLQLTTHQLRA